METITFTTIDNNITFTVKADFAVEVPNYREIPVKELVEKHNMFNFFHNPNGPAIIDNKTGNKNYFLNAKMATGDDLEKIKHREQFNGKMDAVLNEKA